MEPLIVGMMVLIVLVSLLPILVLYMSRRRQDEFLASFYKACDQLRNHIHSASSLAEIWELVDELDHMRDTFVNSIPSSVLDKELTLLESLLNKKNKKIKRHE